jgi:hypothetical protein
MTKATKTTVETTTSRTVPREVLGAIKDKSRDAWLQPRKSKVGTSTNRKKRNARRGWRELLGIIEQVTSYRLGGTGPVTCPLLPLTCAGGKNSSNGQPSQ